MRILINEEITLSEWNKMLDSNQFASPFQTPAFYLLFKSLNGYSADVFAMESEGEYKALVVVTIQKEKGLKSYFSKRGIVYGGPLLVPNADKYLNKLLSELKNFYKWSIIYLEIRNYFDFSSYMEIFESEKFRYIPWLNFQLNTTDIGTVKKSMSNSRLRQINKATKIGVIWKEAQSLDEIDDFYNILSDLYQKNIKKPLFPRKFFIEFYNNNSGKYLLVQYDGKTIGGIMCIILSGKAIYEFFVCGMSRDV